MQHTEIQRSIAKELLSIGAVFLRPEEPLAKELLSIGAVFLRPEEPFTWASGIKSPIYCDNRLTLSAPAIREKVENGLASLVREYWPECEMLMGTSTAGIAHAAITATLLGLPMGYVRSSACPWATCARRQRATDATTASRAGWRRGRRW